MGLPETAFDTVISLPVDLSPIGRGYAHVDRIKSLNAQTRTIVTSHLFNPNRELNLRDHFRGDIISPGCHLLEAVVQSAIPLGRELAGSENADMKFVLGGFERVRFRRKIRPGDQVDILVTINLSLQRLIGSAEFRATVGVDEAALGKFIFAFEQP